MRKYLAARQAFSASALLVPLAAHAATASIDVRGADGRPLADAVVTIDSARQPAGPIRFAWPPVMSQHHIAFDPHVLIVPVGATVSFPNLDQVRHHVYSFSKAKKFDLKLYGNDETRSVTFDKPGVVALGCNIHDAMSGFVVVVDTPYAMKTGADGHVTIADLPPGGATVRLWHPSIKARDNMLTQAVTIAPSGFAATYTVRGK